LLKLILLVFQWVKNYSKLFYKIMKKDMNKTRVNFVMLKQLDTVMQLT